MTLYIPMSFLLCIVTIQAVFIYPPCPESETNCESVPNSVSQSAPSYDLSQNRDFLELPTASSDKAVPKKIKTRQYYKDIPVFDATLIVEEDGDKVRTPVYGNWYDESEIQQQVPNTQPTITNDEALDIVLNELHITASDIGITISSELYIYYENEKPFLVYIIEFTYVNPDDPDNLYQPLAIVKARGNIRGRQNILKLYNEPRNMMALGAGGNAKTGPYQYNTWIKDVDVPKLQTSNFVVYDKGNRDWDEDYGWKFKCKKTNDWKCDADYYEDTTNGGFGTGLDAYHHAKQTFNMYNAWMGEYPITSPKPFPIYVHVGNNWENAHFYYDRINIGDGDTYFYPLVTITIVAHEIAHGYTDRYSDLIYEGESGGMNEAYSDIVAVCAKKYFKGDDAKQLWYIGYDALKSTKWKYNALRYMFNPPADGDSIDDYCDYYDGLDVHHSSGVYNKAAYNMYNSETRPWDIEEIFKVFSTANKYYWTQSSTMRQGLCGLIYATNDLFDNESDFADMKTALKDAFADVGLKCWSSSNC